MIKKIFKTIFIISLCFASIINSNAAVSVSDGSAFLTKSELQSNLNNLSNRMAQLENSLDAKIDSLVSAYLTRNGIWNGRKVEIDMTATNLKGTNFISSWNSWEEKSLTVWTKSASIEKTGMCVTIVHIEGHKGTYGSYRCYLRYRGGSFCGFEDDVKVMLWMNEKIGTTTYGRNSIQVSQSQQRITTIPSSAGECIAQLPLNNDYVLLGFVSKDSTLQLGLTQYVWDYQSGNSTMETSCGIFGDSYLQIYISDCNIY